jgi:hypothetical protein
MLNTSLLFVDFPKLFWPRESDRICLTDAVDQKRY